MKNRHIDDNKYTEEKNEINISEASLSSLNLMYLV